MRGGATVDAQARPPVVVLTGIGLTAAVGLRLVDALQAHFEVIAAPVTGRAGDRRAGGRRDAASATDRGRDGRTDSRAGGRRDTAPATERGRDRRTDRRAGGLAVTTADDVLALLDGAGVDEAHVVGLSFGGVIGQEIAIRYPRRVRSLVLGSSSAGGRLYVPPSRAIREFVRRLSDVPAEEGLWAAVPYLYAETTYRRHAPRIGEDIALRLRASLDPRRYRRQYAIARAHDTGGRLGQITAPTLVIHGEEDRLLPVDNGRLLAGAIGGAQLLTLPGGAHAFPTDVPDANLPIINFFRVHSQWPAATAPRGPAGTRKPRATRA